MSTALDALPLYGYPFSYEYLVESFPEERRKRYLVRRILAAATKEEQREHLLNFVERWGQAATLKALRWGRYARPDFPIELVGLLNTDAGWAL